MTNTFKCLGVCLFIFFWLFYLNCGHIFAENSAGRELVSTRWLAANLKDPSVVVIHVGRPNGYEAVHITGALLLPSKDLYRDTPDGLSHQFPDLKRITVMVAELGLSAASRIVLYFEDARFASSTARAFLTLKWVGLGDRLSILDGGLPNWKAEKGPVSSKATPPTPAPFEPVLKPELLVDKEWVKAHLTDPDVVIIDSRPEPAYTGAYKDFRFKRHGHISGSFNLPFFTLMENKLPFTFKDRGHLRAMFENLGAKPGSIVVSYCDSGVWSSLVWFTALHLGYDARFYDGSFQEWSRDDSLEVIGQAAKEMLP